MAKGVVRISRETKNRQIYGKPNGINPNTTLRYSLWLEQGGRCWYCKRHMTMDRGKRDSVTVDHRTPIELGGTDTRDNKAAACKDCNEDKGMLKESEYRAMMDRREVYGV